MFWVLLTGVTLINLINLKNKSIFISMVLECLTYGWAIHLHMNLGKIWKSVLLISEDLAQPVYAQCSGVKGDFLIF